VSGVSRAGGVHLLRPAAARTAVPRAEAHAQGPVSAEQQQPAGNAAVCDLLDRHGEGRALSPDVRGDMEERFGDDFHAVRIHDDPRAAAAATAMSAKAFTVGNDIFASRDVSTDTTEGRKLLSHELAHVVQQRRGGPAPDLDPESALERSADAATEAASGGADEVSVAGASSPGVSRDIFDVQDRLDQRMAADKGQGVPLDPKHLPSFEDPARRKLIGGLPTFEQIMQQAAQRNALRNLTAGRERPQPPPPPPPPPPEPAPPPTPVVPAAKQDDAPGDPQATTATGLGYQGASNLNKGQSNVTLGGNYSPLAGGKSGSVQLATGLHDFGKTGGLAAVVQPGKDPSGNTTVSGYVNPYLAPDGRNFNAGLYLGGTSADGQRPPGRAGSATGFSGVAAGEALLGNRDHPYLTLGANFSAAHPDAAQISPAWLGSSAPSTYLKAPWILGGTGSAQYNYDYYRTGGPDSDYSKTPRYTFTAEGTAAHTFGSPDSQGGTTYDRSSKTTYGGDVGVLRNWRLGNGSAILSAGAYLGVGHEDDTIGKSTYSATRPYGSVVVGGSF
jgi:hypothetical protein